MKLLNVYIAGPLFTTAEINQRIYEREKIEDSLKKTCHESKIYKMGHVYNPKEEIKQSLLNKSEKPSSVIYQMDINAIQDANIFVFDIDNYDSGTMVELGYATAMCEKKTNGKTIMAVVISDFRFWNNYYDRGPDQVAYGSNLFVIGTINSWEKSPGIISMGINKSFDEALKKITNALNKKLI